MRQAIAILLMIMIVGRFPLACMGQTPAQTNAAPAESAVAQQVRLIPAGAFVEVLFTNRKKARGNLDQVGPDGFSLNTGRGATRVSRRAAFSEVKSVKVVQPGHTPVAAWIATGVISAVVIVVVAVFLIERHNE